MPRVYAPLTAADLDRLAAGESITATSVAHAPAGLSGDALEEAEYEALVEAAATGAELVGEGVRRVVVAADVDSADGTVAIARRQVASFHVDETTEHSDEDLLWYDVAELEDVRALVAGS